MTGIQSNDTNTHKHKITETSRQTNCQYNMNYKLKKLFLNVFRKRPEKVNAFHGHNLVVATGVFSVNILTINAKFVSL